nr:hypothetical protein Iba_chr01bCG16800 [Ipomoea batatas]
MLSCSYATFVIFSGSVREYLRLRCTCNECGICKMCYKVKVIVWVYESWEKLELFSGGGDVCGGDLEEERRWDGTGVAAVRDTYNIPLYGFQDSA